MRSWLSVVILCVAMPAASTHYEIEIIQGEVFIAVWDGAIDVVIEVPVGNDTNVITPVRKADYTSFHIPLVEETGTDMFPSSEDIITAPTAFKAPYNPKDINSSVEIEGKPKLNQDHNRFAELPLEPSSIEEENALPNQISELLAVPDEPNKAYDFLRPNTVKKLKIPSVSCLGRECGNSNNLQSTPVINKSPDIPAIDTVKKSEIPIRLRRDVPEKIDIAGNSKHKTRGVIFKPPVSCAGAACDFRSYKAKTLNNLRNVKTTDNPHAYSFNQASNTINDSNKATTAITSGVASVGSGSGRTSVPKSKKKQPPDNVKSRSVVDLFKETQAIIVPSFSINGKQETAKEAKLPNGNVRSLIANDQGPNEYERLIVPPIMEDSSNLHGGTSEERIAIELVESNSDRGFTIPQRPRILPSSTSSITLGMKNSGKNGARADTVIFSRTNNINNRIDIKKTILRVKQNILQLQTTVIPDVPENPDVQIR